MGHVIEAGAVTPRAGARYARTRGVASDAVFLDQQGQMLRSVIPRNGPVKVDRRPTAAIEVAHVQRAGTSELGRPNGLSD